MNKIDIQKKISIYFDPDELRQVCFHLNLKYENLAGETHETKSISLVQYCFRRGLLNKLVEHCQQERPHVNWAKDDTEAENPKELIADKIADNKSKMTASPFDRLADPTKDKDVLKFAENVELQSNDPNGIEWAKIAGPKWFTKSIEGFWSSRWKPYLTSRWIEGIAQIHLQNEWVHINYEDKGNIYIIRAFFDQTAGILIGRYQNLNVLTDTTPWVGIIVNNRRIDGFWKSGRWDFQR